MSLADVIGEGAGLKSAGANPAKVYVLRDDANSNVAKVYQLDLSSFTSLALAQRFEVQPRDSYLCGCQFGALEPCAESTIAFC